MVKFCNILDDALDFAMVSGSWADKITLIPAFAPFAQILPTKSEIWSNSNKIGASSMKNIDAGLLNALLNAAEYALNDNTAASSLSDKFLNANTNS